MKNVPALVLVCLLPIGGAAAGCYDSANGVQHRFVLNGAEAFDRKSGLRWKRCSLGTTWDGKGGCAGEMEFVSLDVAAQREAARGDRAIELVRGQADVVHRFPAYATEIDTTAAPVATIRSAR